VALAVAKQELDLASSELSVATQNHNQTIVDAATAQTNLSIAQDNLAQAQTNYNASVTSVEQAGATVDARYTVKTSTYNNLVQAQSNLQQAQSEYDTALYNYNNNLISDPSWVNPTQEVRSTVTQITTTTTVISSGLLAKSYNMLGYNGSPPMPGENRLVATMTVPNISFQWSSGQVLNSGLYEDVIVSFTGTINIPADGTYGFYAPADDGTQLFIDGNQIINDWRDKGGGGTQVYTYLTAGNHSITLWYYENGGGANVWLYWAPPGQYWDIVPASAFEQVSVQQSSTDVEVVTVELVPGLSAPLINDPALLTILQQKQSALTSAQSSYDSALIDYNYANQQYLDAQAAFDSATSVYLDKQAVLGLAREDKDVKQQLLENANTNNDNANTTQNSKQAVNDQKVSAVNSATQYNSDQEAALVSKQNEVAQQTQVVATAESDLAIAQSQLESALQEQSDSTNALDQATAAVLTATSSLDGLKIKADGVINNITEQESAIISKQDELASAQQELDDIEPYIEPTPEPTATPSESVRPEPTPEPTPEPKPEVAPITELPKDVSSIDPSTLSTKQVEQLVAVANEVLATAEQGSPAYEKALDALFVAAQADDIQIDPALAAIPGVGQAAEAAIAAINFMGNVGADMAPATREKAKKEVMQQRLQEALVARQVDLLAVARDLKQIQLVGGKQHEKNN
jgi:multidrug efflux pump subunit AcrA (membrane-fusion protein)